MDTLTFAVLTVSDSCFNGTAVDSSGENLQVLLGNKFSGSTVKYMIVPDDLDKIEGALRFLCDVLSVNVIFTTGGTGFSARDVTPEATKRLIEKETPQLTLAMALCSFQKTKYASLSRSVSGIRKKSLIINFPGSKKASSECFDCIADVIPHAVEVILDRKVCVRETHKIVQQSLKEDEKRSLQHICPHETNSGGKEDRNSPFPMIAVNSALEIIFDKIKHQLDGKYSVVSSMNLPPFRASIKDGYALKSAGGSGLKTVIGYIPAGYEIITKDFSENECFKISTGAPLPDAADCIIQVEDTKLILAEDGIERVVEICCVPTQNIDIRPIGCDLKDGEYLFGSGAYNPGDVVFKSLMGSIGQTPNTVQPIIGIISTGDELTEPGHPLKPGKIYDTNTTMLKQLLQQFGFTQIRSTISADSFDSLHTSLAHMTETCQVTICTGGVSMGDKDFVKACLKELEFEIHFGRINMKPGKPMTYAFNGKSSVFGLPGNPVSAFVCFHLFVLPALRLICDYPPEKLSLSIVEIELINDKIELDPRPEYARAIITSKSGKLYAEVTGNQISSRLKSIYGADVLLHLPARTEQKKSITKGTILKASVLKHDFISKYQ